MRETRSVCANLKNVNNVDYICSLISTIADYSIDLYWVFEFEWGSSHHTTIATYVRDFCYVNVAVDAIESDSKLNGVRVSFAYSTSLKAKVHVF